MWGAALPLQPWLPTAKPPMGVHNLQNRQEMGRLVVAALESNEPQTLKPQTNKVSPPPELSGSDVLVALQRATAQKSAQKHNNSKKKQKSVATGGAVSNSKALCIKPEWSDRLHQLGRRLQELSHA